MTTIYPLQVIPETWAEKAICPICKTHTLCIQRQPETPDQLACARCTLAFQIEAGGSRVQITSLPGFLRPCPETLAGQWLSPQQLREVIQKLAADFADSPAVATTRVPPQQSQTVNTTPAIAPPPQKPARQQKPALAQGREKTPPESKLTQAQVTEQARQLFTQGNSRDRIQYLLTTWGATSAQIQLAFTELKKLEKQKGTKVWLIGSVVTVLMMFGCGIGILLLSRLNISLPSLPPLELTVPRGPDWGAEPTIPPNPILTMPASGRAYFEVLQNLKGTHEQKAAQLQAASPPPELAGYHLEVVEACQAVARAEKANKTCTSTSDCIWRKLDYDEAQSRLIDSWQKATAQWEEYYRKYHQPFPRIPYP